MILANEGYIAKMAILGMSSSNFYSAQNTVSRSQITLEIKKNKHLLRFSIDGFSIIVLQKNFLETFFGIAFFGYISLTNPV